MLKQVGLIGFGSYLPYYRIRVAEIASVWGKKPEVVKKSLGVFEKTVPGHDEDAVTMGVEASRNALSMAGIESQQIEALYVGSESHPYAVNPSATIVGEALGLNSSYLAADLEFACKAGTAGWQNLAGLLESGLINYGIAIGSDAAQAKPHDVLEYTAAGGATAFILGNNKKEFLAEVVDFASYCSDTPDFWRRDGVAYPSHQGRFTGEPAYFAHVIGASQSLLKKLKMKPADFAYVVFHMPNGRFPQKVAQKLGFTEKQLLPGLIVEKIGNPYSASSLLGLCRVLGIAKPGKLIFMTSYGSGAGADSFVLKTTRRLVLARKKAPGFDFYLQKKKHLSYSEYLKMTGKL